MTTKDLTAIQVSALELKYSADIRSAYARYDDNGKTLDFIVHFSDGTTAWIDANSRNGIFLSTVRILSEI